MYPPERARPGQVFPDLRFPPFQGRSPAVYAVHGDQLISDTENALKNYADIYGAKLFQARDDTSLQLSQLGEDSEFRAKMGKVNAAKFEKFAALPAEQREIATQMMTSVPQVTLATSFGRWLNKFGAKRTQLTEPSQ